MAMKQVRPPEPLGLSPSFGFGDRLGLATPGHLYALRAHGGPIRPIFAQQSIRELERTKRKPSDVIEDAYRTLEEANYSEPWGADADHLKSQDDVNATAGAGFVFFTIDPSEYVDELAETYSQDQLRLLYRDLRDDVNWIDDYKDRVVDLAGGVQIEFGREAVLRCAIKYGRAISHAIKMAAHVDRVMSKRSAAYEIELSVDETPNPTTWAEHFIIAEQCLQANMKLVSLAPRYVGRFEKGVDFRGDNREFERSLKGHAAIADSLGPYKLSLHSGSDKFSIYESFARITGGRFHVKTAGTSYLEGLRVAARHAGKLFRRIVEFSRERFETDRASYQISGRIENTPVPGAINDDARLESLYLDSDDGRQILHVTYGSVLTNTSLGPALRDVLAAEPATHKEVLARHLGKHLKLLAKGIERA